MYTSMHESIIIYFIYSLIQTHTPEYIPLSAVALVSSFRIYCNSSVMEAPTGLLTKILSVLATVDKNWRARSWLLNSFVNCYTWSIHRLEFSDCFIYTLTHTNFLYESWCFTAWQNVKRRSISLFDSSPKRQMLMELKRQLPSLVDAPAWRSLRSWSFTTLWSLIIIASL